MPRLESKSVSPFITSRSSSGSQGVLAKISNEIPRNTSLDQNTYTPQGTVEMENPTLTRQGDLSPASNGSTHSVSTALPSPLSQASSRLTIANVIITSPSRPAKKTELLSDTLATEISSLTKLVESVSPQAAGHVLQKCWRKFFLLDESNDHLYWALRTGIQNAPRALIESLLKDQSTLDVLLPVAREKQAVVQAVLNNIAYDELFKHISNDVLDRVISLRLKTIPAKSLIRWLAEAERLGFQEDDILDDDDESAVPNISIPESSATQASYVNGQPSLGLSAPNSVASGSGHISVNDYSPSKDVEMAHPRPAEQDPSRIAANPPTEGQNYHHRATTPSTVNTSNNTPLTCPLCYFVFAHRSCYLYHLNKKVCKRLPPPAGYDWRCDNCGQGFKTRQGMNYHVYLNKVCFDGDITPATAPPQHNQVAMNPQQRNLSDRILPLPRPSFYASQQLQPQYRAPLPTPSPQSGGQSYRHLSTGGVISKTPLHTPNHNRPNSVQTGPLAGDQATSSFRPRMSPSELSPLRLAELNQALAKQEAKYQAQVAAIDPSISPQERAARLQSLKNGHATKKSQIRKAFNVTLRMGDKDKAARSAVMTTPAAGLNFEDYRANPNHTPRVPPPQTSESISDRSSALSLHPSSFSPINSMRTNEQNRHGSQPISQRSSTLSSPVSRSVQATSYEVHPRRRDIPPSPVEKYPPQAHKRQRIDSGVSPTYTNPTLPNPAQAQSQTFTAGPGDKARPQDSASREVYNDETIQSSSGTGPTNSRTRFSGASTTDNNNNNNNNNNEPIEVLSSSESSGGGNIVPHGQPGPMPRVAGRADEGSARGVFTAKRGKH